MAYCGLLFMKELTPCPLLLQLIQNPPLRTAKVKQRRRGDKHHSHNADFVGVQKSGRHKNILLATYGGYGATFTEIVKLGGAEFCLAPPIGGPLVYCFM